MTMKKLDVEGYLKNQEELEKKVVVDGDHILLALPEGKIDEWYEIPLSRLETSEQIISWIFHLTEKSWIEKDVFRRFIKVISELRGISL